MPGGAGDREDLFAARRIARETAGDFPFRCFRSGPPPHPPVPDLAGRFVRALRAASPRGPYVLVGDCVGGIVAYAMARRLRAEGEEVRLLALLDAPFPNRGRRRRAWLLRHAPGVLAFHERLTYFRRRLTHHLGVLRELPRGRLAYARRLGGVGLRGLAPPGEHERGPRRRLGQQRASYVGAALAWRPLPYDGRVLIVESAESERLGHGAAWQRAAPSSEIVRVPGEHARFILDHGAFVGEALRRALEAGGERA